MLKYSKNLTVYGHLKIIYEIIINRQIIPNLFNNSIIKPLIENSKKSTCDINNLRPIAISDSFSNLFEFVMLEELNKREDHP